MSEFLLSLVLALHLVLVNVAGAGPLVCLWCEWREARGCALAGQAGRWMAKWSLLCLLVGAALGVAVGILLWSDEYANAVKLLGHKVMWGSLEWLFSVALATVYWAWWVRAPQASSGARMFRSLLTLASGLNLLYHFPTLFAVLGRLNETQPVDVARFRQLMAEPPVVAMSLHFVLASFAVAGVAWLALALQMHGRGQSEAAARVAVWGGRLALVPTLAQLVVGLWVVVTLGKTQQMAIMGKNLPATIAFALSLLLALWSMHLLASAAFGKSNPRRWRMTLLVTLLVVLGMCYVERVTKIAKIPANVVRTAPHIESRE